MFKHLFKLIWNKKKQNFLLMSEMLFSFLVLFAVFTMLVFYYFNYKKPLGINPENVWQVNFQNGYSSKNTDSLNTYYLALRKSIISMPQIKEVSFCSNNIPFSNNTYKDEFKYKNISEDGVYRFVADDHFLKALDGEMVEGRWFNSSDMATKEQPVVINSEIRERLFGKEPAAGKIITSEDGKNKMKIVGVVQAIKVKGDYAPAGTAVYNRADTSHIYEWTNTMLIKVSDNADAAFEARLYKTLANYMKGANVEITHLTNLRKNINYFTLVPMIVMTIVGCFLVINVALGLFGVLWYNINKRRGEIGLRRAVGATGNSISSQLIAESLILATLSLIIGTFFAVQFPLLNVFDLSASIYIIAILFAIVFIYLLVFLCSLYPGRQAAAIYPAVALHEE